MDNPLPRMHAALAREDELALLEKEARFCIRPQAAIEKDLFENGREFDQRFCGLGSDAGGDGPAFGVGHDNGTKV